MTLAHKEVAATVLQARGLRCSRSGTSIPFPRFPALSFPAREHDWNQGNSNVIELGDPLVGTVADLDVTVGGRPQRPPNCTVKDAWNFNRGETAPTLFFFPPQGPPARPLQRSTTGTLPIPDVEIDVSAQVYLKVNLFPLTGLERPSRPLHLPRKGHQTRDNRRLDRLAYPIRSPRSLVDSMLTSAPGEVEGQSWQIRREF